MAEGLSDADIGLSDSDIGLTEPQPSQQAPTQAQGLSDDEIGLSDADIGLPPTRPQAEGELATGAREAAHGVLPAAGGLAGMGYGAAIGSAAGPVGTFFGGLGGLILGSMATNKVQDVAQKAIGMDDSEQRAANIAANPKSAFLGGLAPALASMNPAAAGVKLGERAIGAVGMGGFEAGQEYLNEGKVDPFNVAAAGVAGAVAPRLNKFGQAASDVGEMAAAATRKVAGRPAAQPNPAAAPAQDEAASSQQATVTGDTSLQQPAPTEAGNTTGNPQSAPERSARAYPKQQGNAAPQPDILTTGGFSPDIADALTASLDANSVVDRSPQPEIPDASNGVNPDMTYKGEQLPRETGIEQAAPPAAPAENAAPAPDTRGPPAQAAPAAENSPAPVVGQFKTAKGSTYDLHPDNTTTRNKAARPDPGHEGDEGLKPRSAKTYFMEPQALNALGPPQDSKWRLVDHNDGTLSLATRNKDGRWGISPTQRGVPVASMEPREGLHPLEVWSPQQGKGVTSYGAMHGGNEITQLGQNGPRAKTPILSDDALLDVSRVQREAATRNKTGGEDQEPPPPTLDVDRPAAPAGRGGDTGLTDEAIGLPPEKLSSAVHAERDNVHPSPSPAQAEAGNFAKGHPGKLFKRGFSIETAKGGTRRDLKNTPPQWEVPNYPTDYGELLGTKGADKDRLDVHYVGTGDKHYVIDQRNPDGAFDEHKIMAYAKDQADALDHYKRGFNDDKDRVGAITEVSEPDMTKWVNSPGAKKTPYAADKFSSGPTEGVKPLPKVVTAAVNALKEKGLTDAATKLEAMEPSERIAAASKFVNKTDAELKRPDRIRTAAPVVEGIKNNEGGDVTARSKGDAAAKSADVKTMNDAYEKVKGMEIPKTPEEKAALLDKLRTFLDETKDVKYRPAFKHEPYVVARAAKKLLLAKNPTENGWKSFIADALIPDETRATNRIDSDIGMSRRSGDDAIANAENKAASTNDVEDQMLANIDAKRGRFDAASAEYDMNRRFAKDDEPNLDDILGEGWRAKSDPKDNYETAAFKVLEQKARESKRQPFDLDNEHIETEAKPAPVQTAKDLEKFDTKQAKLDLAKPADRAKLQTETAKLADNLVKTADRKDAVKPAEERSTGDKGRKIDIKSIDQSAMIRALEAARKKTTAKGAITEEELGKYSTDTLPKDKLAEFWNKGSTFLGDNSASLDYKKIAQDWRVKSLPAQKYLTKALGALFNDRQRRADARLAQVVSTKDARQAEKAHMLFDARFHMWLDKSSKPEMITYLKTIEKPGNKTLPEIKQALIDAGIPPEKAEWMKDEAQFHRNLMDQIWKDDAAHGSDAAYVENYVSHIFDNEKGAQDFIEARIKSLGATWYQKERMFDLIDAAMKAGFKLKFENPIDLINARMEASITSNTIVDAARALQKDGLAFPIKDAPDGVAGAWDFKRQLPDGNQWVFAPDTVDLWKNGIEAQGLNENKGTMGSIYRGWMAIKRVVVPIQLMLSAFHELHIVANIMPAQALHTAFESMGAGTPAMKAYTTAFKQIGHDALFAMPLDKLPLVGPKLDKNGAFSGYVGRRIQDIWKTPDAELSSRDLAVKQAFQEAGVSPYQSREDVIGAKVAFARAVADIKTGVTARRSGKLVWNAIQRGMEKLQEPMFKYQIPALKNAALLRSLAVAMQANRDLAVNPTLRGQVFRELGKDIDDRFGEMFYKGLFWNKSLKDAGIGSMLSLSWNLGQLRQVAGAGRQIVRLGSDFVGGNTRSSVHDARATASNKLSFVAHYVGLSMLTAGTLSYALSGKFPTGMDYTYPRNGQDNADGTPQRLTSPFNTREAVMLKAHADEHNSWVGGAMQLMWNKMVLQPIAELATNKDFFGNQVYDTNAPWYKSALQAVDGTLGREFNPIAISGANRSDQLGGGTKGRVLAYAGFGPAPKYVNETPLQRRINHLFTDQGAPSSKPYQYGPKTGLGSGLVQNGIRYLADDKLQTEARQEGRQKLDQASVKGDTAAAMEARKELISQGGLSQRTVAKMRPGQEYQYKFSRLPKETQLVLAKGMTPAEYTEFVITNREPGLARKELAQQRNLNH